MQWTSEKPTAEGWYLYRDEVDPLKIEAVQVENLSGLKAYFTQGVGYIPLDAPLQSSYKQFWLGPINMHEIAHAICNPPPQKRPLTLNSEHLNWTKTAPDRSGYFLYRVPLAGRPTTIEVRVCWIVESFGDLTLMVFGNDGCWTPQEFAALNPSREWFGPVNIEGLAKLFPTEQEIRGHCDDSYLDRGDAHDAVSYFNACLSWLRERAWGE